jgi:hypothetical protein
MDPRKRSVTIEVMTADEQVVGGGRFATGQGRKTDATDAHSVALVGTRVAGLRPWWPTSSSTYCGCWPTAAGRWARSTPARSASSMRCCWS